jgi:hypothetical protein
MKTGLRMTKPDDEYVESDDHGKETLASTIAPDSSYLSIPDLSTS